MNHLSQLAALVVFTRKRSNKAVIAVTQIHVLEFLVIACFTRVKSRVNREEEHFANGIK